MAQTYPHWEIIVVDDGSTDDTASVAMSFGKHVRYIHQENMGLPAARNTGIQAADTELVAFLDADDIWLPGYLEAVTQAFRDLSPDYGLVATKSLPVGASGEAVEKVRRDTALRGELGARDIILRTCFSPSCVTARRESLLASGLFDATLTSSEDRDMWIRIGVSYRLFLLDAALVQIRDHAQSMSKHADRMKRNTRKVIAKAYRDRTVPRSNVPFWLHVLAFNWFQCAWMYHDEGRPCRAALEMLKSLGVWPWFMNPDRFNEPLLFRIRALRRFACSSLASIVRLPFRASGKRL